MTMIDPIPHSNTNSSYNVNQDATEGDVETGFQQVAQGDRRSNDGTRSRWNWYHRGIISCSLIALAKGLLSLWIVLHVFLIVVLPNSASYVGRIMPNWMLAYGNSLGLHSNWNFFSPDPAHTMYFRYKVFFQDPQQNELREPIEGFLPSYEKQSEMALDKRRELYEMRFMVLDTKRIKKFIAPWLCKQYPGATQLFIEHIIETIAPLDVAAIAKSSMEELSTKIEYVSYDFSCQGELDDVDI